MKLTSSTILTRKYLFKKSNIAFLIFGNAKNSFVKKYVVK